jgi:hypothetical protein
MTTVITREQGYPGLVVELIRVTTTATLAQVQTAGWWNNSPISGETISSVDQVQICYSYGTSLQATAIFNVAIGANRIVTLSVAETSVTLPTVANHLAIFTNTTGGLADSGLLLSNVVAKNAINQMAAGAEILLDKGTGTVSTGAVTINKQSGVITVTVSTAATATTTVTFNNSEIASTSVILVSLMGGTNAIPGVQLSCVYTSAGIADLLITNNNVAGSALSGTLIIGFIVV